MEKAKLSIEEKKLLLDILFKQEYALALVSSELTDIECGAREVDTYTYKQIINLYQKLSI